VLSKLFYVLLRTALALLLPTLAHSASEMKPIAVAFICAELLRMGMCLTLVSHFMNGRALIVIEGNARDG
jgi:hypothetical protein